MSTSVLIESYKYTKQEYNIESYDDNSCVLVSVLDETEKFFFIAKNSTQYNVMNKFFVSHSTLLNILERKVPNLEEFDFVEIPFADNSWGLFLLGNRTTLRSTIVTLKYLNETTYVGYPPIRDTRPLFESNLDDFPFEISEQDIEVTIK